jgi:DNA-binding GntR family transcriptional regulator
MPSDSDDVDVSLVIHRASTADQVANVLRETILRGDLKPGTPLREIRLAGSLGVSRNTTREGMRILVNEGLLQHNIHRGVVVTTLTESDVHEIYRVRVLLETAAVRRGGRLNERLEDLRRIAQALEVAASSQDVRAVVDLDLSFHLELVDALGSARLTVFCRNMLAELRLGLFLLDQSEDDPRFEWADTHSVFCDLLEAGKRADCAKALSEHLRIAEQRLTTAVAAQG